MTYIFPAAYILSLLVFPTVIWSFWRFTRKPEFQALRNSGQKLNLNMANLFSGFQRTIDDPLRESHIKLAKIGFWHWVAMPVSFLVIFVGSVGMAVIAQLLGFN